MLWNSNFQVLLRPKRRFCNESVWLLCQVSFYILSIICPCTKRCIWFFFFFFLFLLVYYILFFFFFFLSFFLFFFDHLSTLLTIECAHSVSTLISVTFVTFVLAVLLTALAFICCKKYWKEQEGNSSGHGTNSVPLTDDDEETMSRFRSLRDSHFYRLACSSSNAPLVPFSPSFQSNSGTLNSPSVTVAPNATSLDVAAAAVQLLSNQPNSLLLQSYPLLTAYTGHHRISSSSNSTSNSTSIGVTSLDSASIVQAAIASYLNCSNGVTTSDQLPPPSYPPPPYESHLSIHELADETSSNVNSVTTESVPDVVTVSSECNNSSTSSCLVGTNTTTTVSTCSSNLSSLTNNGNLIITTTRGGPPPPPPPLNSGLNNQLDSHNNHRNRLLSQDSATSLQGNHLRFHTNNNNCSTHGTTVGINGIEDPSNRSTSRSKPLWRKLSQ